MGNLDRAASEGIDRLRRGSRPMTQHLRWGGGGEIARGVETTWLAASSVVRRALMAPTPKTPDPSAAPGGPESRAPAGWVVAVLLEPGRDPEQGRRYFAIGRADRAQAEWVAVDMAISLGLQVAVSPARGEEPVQALAALSPVRMRALGLASGERRDLGDRRPRRWLTG
jgi:hypothetical protein